MIFCALTWTCSSIITSRTCKIYPVALLFPLLLCASSLSGISICLCLSTTTTRGCKADVPLPLSCLFVCLVFLIVLPTLMPFIYNGSIHSGQTDNTREHYFIWLLPSLPLSIIHTSKRTLFISSLSHRRGCCMGKIIFCSSQPHPLLPFFGLCRPQHFNPAHLYPFYLFIFRSTTPFVVPVFSFGSFVSSVTPEFTFTWAWGVGRRIIVVIHTDRLSGWTLEQLSCRALISDLISTAHLFFTLSIL